MKKLIALALVALSATPALAGSNQFNNWKHNQGQGYNQRYNDWNHGNGYYYQQHHHHNNNNGAWALGGFLGGLVIGGALNQQQQYYAPPPPPVQYCGTIWRMEPDGFGGWQQMPYTVCQ